MLVSFINPLFTNRRHRFLHYLFSRVGSTFFPLSLRSSGVSLRGSVEFSQFDTFVPSSDLSYASFVHRADDVFSTNHELWFPGSLSPLCEPYRTLTDNEERFGTFLSALEHSRSSGNSFPSKPSDPSALAFLWKPFQISVFQQTFRVNLVPNQPFLPPVPALQLDCDHLKLPLNRL